MMKIDCVETELQLLIVGSCVISVGTGIVSGNELQVRCMLGWFLAVVLIQ